MPIRVTGDVAVDDQLTSNPFALLTAMLLDQQFPMERAFRGPHLIAERMAAAGSGRLEPATVADHDPDAFVALCTGPPAVHRFPGAMAGRIQALARYLVETYDGDAAAVWTKAADAPDVLRRLKALPGYGVMKATIFFALIGKQLGVRPEGWAEVVGPLSEEGSYLSVADVIDAESLVRVREYKQSKKQGAKRAR